MSEDLKRAISALKAGRVLEWNAYASAAPAGEAISINLRHQKLDGANFDGLNLRGSNFVHVSLKNASFRKTSLDNVSFDTCVLVKCNFNGATGDANSFIDSYISKTVFVSANLHGSNFKLSRLHQCSFISAAFKNSSFHGVTASQSNFTHCKLQGTTLPTNSIRCCFDDAALTKTDAGGSLRRCSFVKATGSSVYWSDTLIRQCNFSEAIFSELELQRAKLFDVLFIQADLVHSNWTEAHVENCSIEGATLTDNSFQSAVFLDSNATGSDLSSSSFEGALLENCNLSNADFRNGTADANTHFFRNQSQGALVGKPQPSPDTLLAQFRKGTHDDLPALQVDYSGYYRWIHISALLVFLFPYTWFLLRTYMASIPTQSDTSSYTTVGNALLAFIYKGTEGEHLSGRPGISFYLFILSFAYNLLRATLLLKVHRAETLRSIQKRSAPFRLESPVRIPLVGWSFSSWRSMLTFARYAFYANIMVVLIHSVLFLLRRVPLN